MTAVMMFNGPKIKSGFAIETITETSQTKINMKNIEYKIFMVFMIIGYTTNIW